ncbi:DUF3106 domain-containing protein [Rhodoferax sp.]|uniref:DUF3106 domain-containing protein n=1 Tax=Rhodoferax sp. TaxID=50421 RepID=UPI0025DE4080|nr:DUF3106 domain-containing protein [Rhodoferax sp.]
MTRIPLKLVQASAFAAGLVSLFIGISAPVLAQTAVPLPAAPASTNLNWTSLTAGQQTALTPLKASWDTLADGHKRKWIALSQNFATMSSADRETLHSRMVDWAALKPKERQQARLNFAETKKTPPTERLANWEAYQALSQDERDALARKGAAKPAGAAVAAKAPSPQKLTPVPVTRNSPDTQRERLAAQQPVDKNTLLPLAPASKNSSSD